MRDVYYSPDMSPEDLLPHQVHFQPESSRALTDMSLLGFRFPRSLPRLPALVLGGECDAVFPSSLLCFYCRALAGESRRSPTGGSHANARRALGESGGAGRALAR